MITMDTLFAVHMLGEDGRVRAKLIAEAFDTLHDSLCKIWVGNGAGSLNGREQSIVRTKLEEACFYAKKAMAMQKENQA